MVWKHSFLLNIIKRKITATGKLTGKARDREGSPVKSNYNCHDKT